MKTKSTKHIVAENILRLMASSDPTRNTQLGLSKRAGVAQSSIGRLMRGEVEARLDLLEAVARALDTTVGDLTTARDSGYIQYDRKRFAQLPQAEREKAETFISFLIESHERSADTPRLDFSQISQPSAREKTDASTVGKTRVNHQSLESNETREKTRSRSRKKHS